MAWVLPLAVVDERMRPDLVALVDGAIAEEDPGGLLAVWKVRGDEWTQIYPEEERMDRVTEIATEGVEMRERLTALHDRWLDEARHAQDPTWREALTKLARELREALADR